MGAAFLTPREAVEAGVPRSTAHRVKDDLAGNLQGLLLVVDGSPITSPAELLELLNALSARAAAAEHEVTDVRARATQLDQELQLTRHELDAQRDRAAALNPRLAAMAAQITQMLTENLSPPESRL